MSNSLLTNVFVGASADTWGSKCPTDPVEGETYLDTTKGEVFVWVNGSWRAVAGGLSRSDPPRPTQRHQGDLMWVSDIINEDRELVMQAGEETGTKLIWIDEVAEQSDLENDPNAKHYGSLWSYDRDLGKFWKRYWELKGA